MITVYAVEYVDYEGWIETLYQNRPEAEQHLDCILAGEAPGDYKGKWKVVEYPVYDEYPNEDTL